MTPSIYLMIILLLQVLLWDTRAGNKPALAIPKAHTDDIQAIDWSGISNQIATGDAKGVLKVWDPRALGTTSEAQFVFEEHSGPILRVEWNPVVAVSGGC